MITAGQIRENRATAQTKGLDPAKKVAETRELVVGMVVDQELAPVLSAAQSGGAPYDPDGLARLFIASPAIWRASEKEGPIGIGSTEELEADIRAALSDRSFEVVELQFEDLGDISGWEAFVRDPEFRE